MLIASIPAYFEGERNKFRRYREQRQKSSAICRASRIEGSSGRGGLTFKWLDVQLNDKQDVARSHQVLPALRDPKRGRTAWQTGCDGELRREPPARIA